MVFAIKLIEKSPSMDTDDDSSSSSSNSTTAMDDYQDLPFDFILKDNSHAESEKENSDGARNSDADGFNSPAESLSSLNPPKSSSGDDFLRSQNDNAVTIDSITSGTSICSDAIQSVPSSSPTDPSVTIPHRGSLRRVLNPSSFHVSQNAIPTQALDGLANQSQSAAPSWPMYAINVSTEVSRSQQSNKEPIFQSTQQHQCYQIIFDREQYEFCTRLFALLDTESQSFIGPDCIREFVCFHCPVVGRRDEAVFVLRCSENLNEESEREKGQLTSPTFDEIWDRTIHSDPRYSSSDASTQTTHQIGIEGWLVFCRLLALAHHQESQRRFASRHLQQMMRHKHGGGTTRMNEVVVVIDNPPPGPPTLISMRGLVDVEQERVMSHSDKCIQGWPFCPLPLPELDLDHSLVSTYSSARNSLGVHRRQRGKIFVEPFSSSHEGDFILRFHREYEGEEKERMVVRRSYRDLEWLNAMLKLHKRPGQGHLCGRILPPFPSKQGGFLRQKYSTLPKEALQSSGGSQQVDISERAIAVAKSGMGMISSMAKSVWSGVSGSTPSSSPASSLSKNKALHGKISSPKWACSSDPDDIPTEVAHSLERYLNYLLENNALSTSFPLNAILQASQSGLESAKQTLQDHAKHKKRQRSSLVAATSRDGLHSAASIFSALISKTTTSLLPPEGDDDTPWLRAIASVAMALQFHGILETTGHESTSAKIQHASLPKFGAHRAGSWEDEETGNEKRTEKGKTSRHLGSSWSDSPKSDASFEAGVVNVESELADEQDLGGYDLLPPPGPTEAHRVLNAGSSHSRKVGSSKSQPTRSRFVYETTPEKPDNIYDGKDAVLGSIRVENDIDKLRDIIKSINQTLGKLYQYSASIRSTQDRRNVIQLSLLRDVDSWVDSGEAISQRSLVDGVAALESCNTTIEESNKTITDDMLWQSSLATSAVGAVTEVRDAVRASHTASRAKRAAFMAAEKAKKAYESCDHTSSKEKIQHTQSEASTAQSHAIHATVVEYEANIAKNRSAVSLAQDVKSWNQYRKRELLQTCVQFAKSQQEACRNAADAWGSLRDGLIDSSGCSVAKDEVNILWTNPMHTSQVHPTSTAATTSYINTQYTLASEIPSGLYGSVEEDFAYSHSSGKDIEKSSSTLQDWEQGQQDLAEYVAEASHSMSSAVEGFTDVLSLKESQQLEIEGSTDDVYCLSPPNMSHLDEDYFSFHQSIVGGASSDSDGDEHHQTSSIHESFHSGQNGDAMSTSMQSLIDGLMAWGEEDEQGNIGETYQTDGIIGTSNDARDNLLE